MSLATVPFIQAVGNAVQNVYNLINGRLTNQRANNLDLLTNITGPVALQNYLGVPTPLLVNSQNVDPTVFKALEYIINQLNIIGGNITLSTSGTQVTTIYIPSNDPQSPLLLPAVGNGRFPFFSGPTFNWDSSIYGSYCYSALAFSPSIGATQQFMVPSGSGSVLANAVFANISGQGPSFVGDGWVWSLGNPNTEPAMGLYRQGSGYYFATKANTGDALSLMAISGSPTWPMTLTWATSPSNPTGILFTGGHTYEPSLSVIPNGAQWLQFYIPYQSGVTAGSISYIHAGS